MYFAASLFAAFILTLFLVSKIAKMLHAKRPEMGWVFLASLVGGIAASLAMLPLNLFIQDMDPMIMLIISLVIMLVVSSAAFKYINQMNWGGAVTTNIANVVIGLMTMVAAVVFNGESLQDTFSVVSTSAQKKSALVESVATGELDVRSVLTSEELAGTDEVLETDDTIALEDEEFEPVITELDLMLPAAVGALKAKEKRLFVESRFVVVSVGNIRSAIGQRIRILKKNGNTISGSLKSIRGNNAVLSQRVSAGEAIVPISIATIDKLEVYRRK